MPLWISGFADMTMSYQIVKPRCHLCNKGFRNKWSLNRHERIVHEGEKPYACNICDKAFSTKGNMKVHMLSHVVKDNVSE